MYIVPVWIASFKYNMKLAIKSFRKNLDTSDQNFSDLLVTDALVEKSQ